MFGSKKNKEENRYYLLPGMGRSNRRQHQLYLKIGVVVGLLVSSIIAFLMWFFSRPRL